MASCRIGLDALAGSSPLFAEMTPPRETRLLAHSGLERYSCTLTVSASLRERGDDLATTGDGRGARLDTRA